MPASTGSRAVSPQPSGGSSASSVNEQGQTGNGQAGRQGE